MTSAAGKPLIETFEITQTYRVGAHSVVALDGLSVSIQRGEFVAIMGPSGSGKSTCMHVLGCLQTPTSGTYRFDGSDVTRFDPDALARLRNEQIGFVFQAFHLQPRMTAVENVALPLLYARTPRRQRRASAEAALASVGLANRQTHRATELSGGEMQRVAIARALVNSPQLLLTDEPTGALDSATGNEIMQLLVALNSSGVTIVLVTHDEDIAAYATRTLRFRDGKLVSEYAQR